MVPAADRIALHVARAVERTLDDLPDNDRVTFGTELVGRGRCPVDTIMADCVPTFLKELGQCYVPSPPNFLTAERNRSRNHSFHCLTRSDATSLQRGFTLTKPLPGFGAMRSAALPVTPRAKGVGFGLLGYSEELASSLSLSRPQRRPVSCGVPRCRIMPEVYPAHSWSFHPRCRQHPDRNIGLCPDRRPGRPRRRYASLLLGEKIQRASRRTGREPSSTTPAMLDGGHYFRASP